MKVDLQQDGHGNFVVLYVGIGIIFAVLLVAIWKQGLFYDRDVGMLALLLCAASVCMLAALRWDAVLPLPLLYPLLLLIGYLSNWVLGPATVYGTQMQILRTAMLQAWIILLAIMLHRGGDQAKRLITGSILLVGFLISGSALGMLYGWIPNESGVMVSRNSELSAFGFRLGGVVQYPNTLGALAGAFALLSLNGAACTAAKARSQRSVSVHVRVVSTKWLLAAVPIVPHLVVLGLTESRGSWIVFGIVLLVGIWSARGYRAEYVTTFLWFGVWSFLAAAWSVSMWQSGDGWLPMPVWLAWIGSIVLFSGLMLRLSQNRWLRNGLILIILPTLMIAGIHSLPTGASSRITDHYATAGARTLFYKDAITLWKEHPWFGAGGDSWRQQFARIQSEPYVGKEVHSSVLDMLLDVGLVFTMPAIGLVLAALLLAWRRHAGFGLAAAMLLAHSLIDFDMSYGLVTLLLAVLLTLGMYDESLNYGSPRMRFALWQVGTKRGKRLAAPLLAAPLAAAIVLASCHLVAQQLATAASAAADRATVPVGIARAHAQQVAALRWAPANTALRIAVSRTLPPQEALALLEEGLRYERDGKGLYRALALASARLGRADDAAAWWEAAVSSDRFDRMLQTEAIEKLALAAHYSADRLQATTYANAAGKRFRQYEAEAHHVLLMRNPANGKRFAMTEEAKRAYSSIVSLITREQ
ncbi:O-antigen ligase family protein [Paenibacillus alvei]|uniref:O-antigen polymerase n=1 Tax=Paenibacillus alvei TaxID=44250 RepID=A0A383R4R4_PAEAL|nr:O-antigen ligase family protein [Paenibacillus alvei]SYX81948.1 O-antigen polymerase [Paenibacillus alvei]